MADRPFRQEVGERISRLLEACLDGLDEATIAPPRNAKEALTHLRLLEELLRLRQELESISPAAQPVQARQPLPIEVEAEW